MVPTNLVIAQSPLAIPLETVRRGAPFFGVPVRGAVMIEFAIVQKWKHTAAPARIPTMSVDSTITFLY